MQHLLIGNGPAGVIAAETLRKHDPGVVVICATGVKPKIAYLEGAGVRIGELGRIAVDRPMRTNLPGVFAVGDCTEAIDFSTGLNAIQPDAADQALVAALNITEREATLRGSLLMNVLATFGVISSYFGQWWGAEGGEHIKSEDKDRFKHLRLEFNGNHLIGATSVRLTEHLGVLRGLIQSMTSSRRSGKPCS